jgi:hypothetical protein
MSDFILRREGGLGVSVSGSVPKNPEPIRVPGFQERGTQEPVLTLCKKAVKNYENIPLYLRNG